MKKQKTQSKIIVALTAVVILLVAISATLTFAYFTANASATSDTMTFGKMGLNLNNLGDNDELLVTDCAQTSCTLNNVVPGCLLTPTGMIEVKNNIDIFVRFRIGIDVDGVDDGEGAQGSADAAAIATLLDTSANLTIGAANTVTNNNANTSANEFTVGSVAAATGYTKYYYTKVVADSQFDTVSVFDISRITLQIPTDFGNAYQGATFTITIEVQAIQAEHLTFNDTVNSNPNAAVSVTAGNDGSITAGLAGLEAATAWASATAANNGADYFAAP